MRSIAFMPLVPLLLCACTAGGNATSAQTLTVAAAADLKFALEDLLAEFAKAHPEIAVKVSYGSSGSYFAQISNGAPFDLFLSADVDYPRKLVDARLADSESLFVYAVGRVVIWVPADSPIDVAALKADALKHPAARKVAIANPLHAPYGRAAEAALKNLGLYEHVKDRLVLGENIAQTAQFVGSGNADIGMIAMSLALAPPLRNRGRYWEIPLAHYPKLEQGGCIMASSRSKDAARNLRSFLLGSRGHATLKRYGFYLPGE